MVPLPPLPYKWIGVALAALAVVAAVFFSIRAYGNARYDSGVADERLVWEKLVAEQNAKLAALERTATDVLITRRDEDRAEIAQDRKELEDAVAAIPDQTTTARQRARACVELRRTGQAPAACDAAPPG